MSNEFPRFFDVDDIPVKVDIDSKSNEIFAINWAGHTYPPMKTTAEGREIDEKTFEQAVKAYQDHFIAKVTNDDEFDSIISKLFGTTFYRQGIDLNLMNTITDKFFNDSSLVSDTKPKFILITGGVGSGKTTMRKQKYNDGYVVIDGGEIFRFLANDKDSDDIEPFLPSIDAIGCRIARKAINERRNIVVEIIGANFDETKEVIDTMTKLGYDAEVIFVDCDPAQARQRHLKAIQTDKLYLSCYFTDSLHRKWMVTEGNVI